MSALIQAPNGRSSRVIASLDSDRSNAAAELSISPDLHWLSALLERVPRGTSLLVAGDPGVGKSTLAQQLALSATAAGEKPVIIATEQSASIIRSRLETLSRALPGPVRSRALREIAVTDELSDLAALPAFLARQVFGSLGRHHGASLLVIDSLHGRGNAASDRRFYEAIFEFLRTASMAGITTLSLAHMTKSRQISGPRSLEHQVDVSILMRHGISCRGLTVPKNRNGASRTEPFSLTVDSKTTCLVPSPLTSASSGKVRSISPEGPFEVEVAVSLPRHERGYVKAPGLSIKEVETIVDLLTRVAPLASNLESLGVTVRAPGGIRYRRDHNLAVALAIASALTRREIARNIVAVGDLDLRGGIHPPATSSWRALADACEAGTLQDRAVLVTGPGAGAEEQSSCPELRMIDRRDLPAVFEALEIGC